MGPTVSNHDSPYRGRGLKGNTFFSSCLTLRSKRSESVTTFFLSEIKVGGSSRPSDCVDSVDLYRSSFFLPTPDTHNLRGSPDETSLGSSEVVTPRVVEDGSGTLEVSKVVIPGTSLVVVSWVFWGGFSWGRRNDDSFGC